ncbi:hypothetical protein [Amycolatopsis sp. Poz14]|uniref:hypothetical protein n=1 Tax=Amycolatopsis sp. Poz14 TaxID=1447705 RepID=UPI001EE851A0|nr:hypothetical protein [Amycolatopsis sp. Poz14]MCG3755729.1 hypothetical protein [Amycolatopsis sp. Poz14]
MTETYQENEDSRANTNPAEQFGPGEPWEESPDPDPDGDERGIDELIEIAEEIPDQLGLSEGLAALRATASREGLSVTVNMHGMLVHLDIGEPALELGPDALAAEISRLSTEAGTKALHQGLRAIRAGCVPAVAAAVGDTLALDEVPEPTPDPATTREPDPAPPPPPPPAPPARRRAPAEESDDGGFVLKPVKD